MGARHSNTAANHMDLLYLTSRRGRKNYIRHPDVVERIGSYLAPEIPLFHVKYIQIETFIKLVKIIVFFVSMRKDGEVITV